MCKYCKNKNNFADVGIRLDTDKCRVYLCGGNSKPPEGERFDFCPKCGTPLGEVEPLTVEQLREIDGKPIFVVSMDGSGAQWAVAYWDRGKYISMYFPNGRGHCLSEYGIEWPAYTQEPKGGAECTN